ncbi:MAG TPA: hypothetical protein VI078_17945 [bacterium]
MRTTLRPLASLALAAAALAGTLALPAGTAAQMCPMGGAQIVAETDRDKTLAWGKGKTRAEVTDSAPAEWSVVTFSAADEGIALLVAPGQVFFGVPGRGGETYPRDIDRAFGADRAKLREAIRATLPELVAAGVVRIDAADIPAIAAAAGLGTLEKGTGGWALKTQDCQAADLPTSGL